MGRLCLSRLRSLENLLIYQVAICVYLSGYQVLTTGPATVTAATTVVPVALTTRSLADQHQPQNNAALSRSNLKINSTSGSTWLPAERMIDWIARNGGEVNVVVAATEEAGRSTWATRAFAKGDVLARIPLQLCYRAGANSSEDLHTTAAHFWADFSSSSSGSSSGSPYQPYFKALPDQSEVWSLHNFPSEYLPFVQSHPVESSIMRNQQQVVDHWQQHSQVMPAALGQATTLDDLRYAMTLLLTRLFNFGEDGLLLIPLLDMANHRSGCPHIHKKEPCDEGHSAAAAAAGGGGTAAAAAAAAEQCVVWRAGEDLEAGQEVCNSYKFMLNDRSLLQYGFLQAGAVEQQLSGIDRHDFDAIEPWQDLPAGKSGPLRFEGTPAALAVELYRLHQLKLSLQNHDLLLAQVAPAPADANSYLLNALRKWRQQRQTAIDLEINRLSRQLQRLQAAERQMQQLRHEQQNGLQQERYNTFLAALQGQREKVDVTIKPAYHNNGPEALEACTSDVSTSTDSKSGSTIPGTCCTSDQLGQYMYRGSTDHPALSSLPASSVFATKSVKAGEAFAIVPLSAAFKVNSTRHEGVLEMGVRLMLDIHQTHQLQPKRPDGSHTAATVQVAATCSTEEELVKVVGATERLLTGTAGDSSGRRDDSSAAFWQAYYATLPPAGAVHGMYSFPLEYLPLVQNAAVEMHLETVQALVLRAWDNQRPTIEAVDDSLTLQEYKHALNLINARLLTYDRGMYLVPLLGMTNRQLSNICPNEDFLDTCPKGTTAVLASPANSGDSNNSDTNNVINSSSGTAAASGALSKDSNSPESSTNPVTDTTSEDNPQVARKHDDVQEDDICIYWVAGEDVTAGQQLCVSYGYVLPDVALLQFGVLLDEPGQPEGWPELLAMDRHDFNPAQPFAPLTNGHHPPAPFAGSPAEALTEVARLTLLYSNLTSAAARTAAAAVQPSHHDPGGRLLAQLQILRQRRIAAIEAEIDRLMQAHSISADVAEQAMQLYAQEQQQQQQYGSAAAAADDIGDIDDDAEDDPWQSMIQWLKAHGAVVDVDIRYISPEAGRAVFAQHAMKKGHVMAAIPLDLAFSTAKHGGNASNQLAAAHMFVMMSDPTNPLQPYFKTLPTKDELRAPLVCMPPQYLPLLHSDILEKSVQAYQLSNQQFWDAYQADLQAVLPTMTLEDFKYARSLLSTRFFGGGPEYGHLMLPLIDMANHKQDCMHRHILSHCPGNPHLHCLIWIAGSYVQPGEEVCNFYQYMLNDRSMIQYGFVQDGMLDVHTIDRPDVDSNSSAVWTMWGADKLGPAPFNGTLQETEAEVLRLTALATELQQGDEAAAAIHPVNEDLNGALLSLLLRWRQMRQEALQRQIVLLQNRAQKMKSGAVETADERLLQWLADNGAKVHPNVHIPHDASGGAPRLLYATGAISAAEHLAVVPMKLAVPISEADLLDDVLRLLPDMRHPASPREPYWAALPANGTVFSFYNFPLEYLALLQHGPSEASIAQTRAVITAFTSEGGDDPALANITLGDVMHVLALVATRAFQLEPYGTFLIPFVDLARHRNGCRNKLRIGRCQSGSDSNVSSTSSSGSGGGAAAGEPPSLCIYWVAGSHIAAGDRLCTDSGYYVHPDRALLQYGHLIAEAEQPPELSGIDRPDFPPDMTAWQVVMDATTAVKQIKGTPAETEAEISRLQQLAAALQEADAAAAAVRPAPADPSGLLLSQLRRWRHQRAAAVQGEIVRLQGALMKQS